MTLTKEQKQMWKKLSTPSPRAIHVDFNDEGTEMYVDRYGDGYEIETFNLSTPWNVSSATYTSTTTHG